MPPHRSSGALPRGEATALPGPGDSGAERLRSYLQAGQVFASAGPASVVTVLGSCVSVCLFDPATGVGGMNHYLLALSVQRERSARFGNVAMAILLDEVFRLGALRGQLRAKVFGGAHALDAPLGNGRSLGQENVELALRTLAAEGIPVVGGDVGGKRGRRILFHPDDGSAWVRTL